MRVRLWIFSLRLFCFIIIIIIIIIIIGGGGGSVIFSCS